VTPEIIAAVEVRGLGPGEDAHAAGPPDALETVDVVLREPLVSPLPALAPIGAREDRAVARPGEDRAALRLDQKGVDVLVGQRAVRDVPYLASTSAKSSSVSLRVGVTRTTPILAVTQGSE
jgi:hypothetical protein